MTEQNRAMFKAIAKGGLDITNKAVANVKNNGTDKTDGQLMSPLETAKAFEALITKFEDESYTPTQSDVALLYVGAGIMAKALEFEEKRNHEMREQLNNDVTPKLKTLLTSVYTFEKFNEVF